MKTSWFIVTILRRTKRAPAASRKRNNRHVTRHLQGAAAAQLIDLMVHLVEDEVLVVLQSKPPSGIDNMRFRQLIYHLYLLEIHHDTAASATGDIAHLRGASNTNSRLV